MLRMAQEIAQSDGKNDHRPDRDRCQRRREERQTSPDSMPTNTSYSNTLTHDRSLQGLENSVMVSAATVSSGFSDEGRPAPRKRRSRRGRNMHRHRLSKHRRDQRARSLKNVMGAPRNDNEYLMSQYNQGLQLGQEGEFSESRVSSYHHPSQDELFLPPAVHGCFSPPPSGQDDLAFVHLSPTLSSPEGSVSSRSSTSDYSSLPGTPNEEGSPPQEGYREFFLASHHLLPDDGERTDQLESGCGVVIDGTDEDFLRRNFEEEYADNITRGLEEATREELITKCMGLMEKLKELEERRCSRGGSSRLSWDARVSC